MDTSHFHLRPLITNTRTAPSSLLLERKAFQCADHYCTVPDTLLYRSLVSLLLQCYSHCSTVFPTLYCSMNIYTILPESLHCTVWHTVVNESLFKKFQFSTNQRPSFVKKWRSMPIISAILWINRINLRLWTHSSCQHPHRQLPVTQHQTTQLVIQVTVRPTLQQ